MVIMRKLHAIVKGRVQGVGFRFFVRREAQDLGLVGYVRNLPDDTVEVEAEGPADKLEELRQRLWQGPALSKVLDVTDEITVATGSFSSFEVRH
jgi:acylphosphatase